MSVTTRHPAARRPWLRVVTLLLALTAVVSTASAPLAGSAVGPRRLDAAALGASKAALQIDARDVLGGRLLELRLPPSSGDSATLAAAEAARRTAGRILDTSVTGDVAVADAIGQADSHLTVVHTDGTETGVAVRGIAGAGFSPTGAWLAGVDGWGRLWRIDPSSGGAARLADGPFGASLAFTADGALLLIALSSPEAPYASRLVRLDPMSRRATALWNAPGFVFSARQLSDGSVAAVVHPLGGGVTVVQLTERGTRSLVELGPRAIDVSLSASASVISYAVAGDGVYLLDRARGRSSRLGAGELPRLAPDGSSLLVLRGAYSFLLKVDGSQLAKLGPTAAWAACGGCRP